MLMRWAWLLSLLLPLAGRAVAQAGLDAPIRVSLPIARAGMAVELNDGRVLVSGRGPRTQILLVDFSKGSATSLDLPPQLSGTSRLLLLWPSGNAVVAWDATDGQGLLLDGSRSMGAPPIQVPRGYRLTGVDSLRRVLTAERPESLAAATGRDSIEIAVRAPNGGPPRAAARLLKTRPTVLPDTTTTLRPIRDRVIVDVRSPSEQAIQFPDGWTGIARVGPYRVDWITRDGATRAGERLGAS